MIPADVELARRNFGFYREQGLEAVEAGTPTAEAFDVMTFSCRILGICDLLQHGDPESFRRHLAWAGQTCLALQRRIREGMPAHPKFQAASKVRGFFDAVAAGDMTLARELAGRMSDTFQPRWEYEEDFLFVDVLRRHILGPDRSTDAAGPLARWLELLEGAPSPAYGICQALIEKDAAAWPWVFDAFLAARLENLAEARKSLAFNKEIHATDGRIYVIGLAILHLADRADLPVVGECEMVPRMARPKGVAGLPPPGSWRQSVEASGFG